MDLPPAPPAWTEPPPPIGAPVETPSSSGRRLVLIAAIILAAVGAVAIVAFLSSDGDAFPESVLGYERLRGDVAERAQRATEGVRIGEIEIRVAVYGKAGRPKLLAATYENYPEGVDVRTIILGAARGAEAFGGTVDEDSIQISGSDGYGYACMRGQGPGFLIPGGPDEQGVMCVFSGATVGLITTTHTTDPVVGLIDVRSFVEASEVA